MLFAEQIVDGLHGVECGQRHLDEEGDPVGHSAVPQSWQFLRLHYCGAFRFLGYETCGGIDILTQVEATTVVILCGTNQIDGVEVSGTGQDGFLFRILAVDLCRFDNLEALDALLVLDKERTATRFALVFHHTTDAYGAVEDVAELLNARVEID